MGFGNQQDGPTGQPLPMHFGMLPGMQVPQLRPARVNVADIYQAAINRAVHDHELDRLFNPDYYNHNHLN